MKQDCENNYLIRPRVSALLAGAIENRVVVVCAGAGCGKTRAVLDFTREIGIPTAWIQLSERDNTPARFWENYVSAVAGINAPLAEELTELGFPGTEYERGQYINLLNRGSPNRDAIIVLDDFHFIENHSLLQLAERRINNPLHKRTVILICRELPWPNRPVLQAKGLIPFLYEDDLNFTESELAQYARQKGLNISRQNLRQIFEDTNGWAFSVDFVVQSLKKAPGYSGYVRSAMKSNVFSLIEAEVWETASERLKRLLICLSLISHLSAELVALLAKEDEDLLAELRRQNAYIRFDGNINAYMLHRLFLDFLRTKQDTLTEAEKNKTYAKAAFWCRGNGFHIDAMSYAEKIGDYHSIVSILLDISLQLPKDIARLAAGIFERAPAETAEKVDFFAFMHVRVFMSLGCWREALELTRRYECQLLTLPESNMIRRHTLGGLYYNWGGIRMLRSVTDDRYDFDMYYKKMNECLINAPIKPGILDRLPMGHWINLTGSAKAGAPQAFIEALSKTVSYVSACTDGATDGVDELCRGELLFYQGDIQAAEPLIVYALEHARERGQYTTVHMALFYMERIAFLRGSRAKAERALKDMEVQLDKNTFSFRFIAHDAAVGWYCYTLRRPDLFPDLLKENFTPYPHAFYIENFANQIKARYHYLTKNYSPLLTYIAEVKRRESVLYGRLEMLAMEACALFQMKDKQAAFTVLREAYDWSSPNRILTPFVEMGKDMRTLTASALRNTDCGISRHWLEDINRKSASYAKYQSRMITDYKIYKGFGGEPVVLSAVETKILNDLYNGLSRSEIAAVHDLTLNVVKLNINNIYEKLNANNLTDLIRIIVERKLI